MKRLLCVFTMVFLFALTVSAGGVMSEFKGIKLGATQKEVHEKLGKPTRSSDDSDDFDIGHGNSLTVSYGSDKTVKSMIFYFSSNDNNVPKFEDVIGGATVENGDGGMKQARLNDDKTKMEVVMTHTAGDHPMTIIVIKSLTS